MDYLTRLAEEENGSLSGLIQAKERSQVELLKLRAICADLSLPNELGVAVIGSLGRHEMTVGSDIDFVVLSLAGEAAEEHRAAVAKILEANGYTLPGDRGPMAKPVHITTLREWIGRDAESTPILTQRILLLLESQSLTNDTVWKQAREDLLRVYFDEAPKDFQPPRFLLNDVARYWRTVCVDFEGKMAARRNEGWVIRNGKLRTLRKMLFAGGLLPILECSRHSSAQIPSFVGERLQLRPAERVAVAALECDGARHGARALGAYSAVLDILNDPDRRELLDRMNKDERDNSELWREVVELGDEFDRGLVDLLFETELAQAARAFAIF